MAIAKFTGQKRKIIKKSRFKKTEIIDPKLDMKIKIAKQIPKISKSRRPKFYCIELKA